MARAGNALTPLPTLTANRNRSNWPAPLTVVRKGGQSAVKVTLGALHDHGRPHARQHAVASQATLPRCAPRPQPPAQRLRPPLGPGLQRDQPPGRGRLREVPGPRRLQVPLVNGEPRRTARPRGRRHVRGGALDLHDMRPRLRGPGAPLATRLAGCGCMCPSTSRETGLARTSPLRGTHLATEDIAARTAAARERAARIPSPHPRAARASVLIVAERPGRREHSFITGSKPRGLREGPRAARSVCGMRGDQQATANERTRLQARPQRSGDEPRAGPGSTQAGSHPQ